MLPMEELYLLAEILDFCCSSRYCTLNSMHLHFRIRLFPLELRVLPTQVSRNATTSAFFKNVPSGIGCYGAVMAYHIGLDMDEHLYWAKTFASNYSSLELKVRHLADPRSRCLPRITLLRIFETK